MRYAWRSRLLWWTFAAESVAVVAVALAAISIGGEDIPDHAVWWGTPLALAPLAAATAVAAKGAGGAASFLVRAGKGMLAVAALGVAQLPVAALVDRPGSNAAAVPAGPALACIACGAVLALVCLPTGYSVRAIDEQYGDDRRTALVALPVILGAVAVMVTGIVLGTTADTGRSVVRLAAALFGVAGEVRSVGWIWTARLAALVLLATVAVVVVHGRRRR